MPSKINKLFATTMIATSALAPSASAGEGPDVGLRPDGCLVLEEVCDALPYVEACKATGHADQTMRSYWHPQGSPPVELIVGYDIGISWGGSCPAGDYIMCSASLRTPDRALSNTYLTFDDHGPCPTRYIPREAWVPHGETVILKIDVEGANAPAQRVCEYVVGTTIEDCTNTVFWNGR